MSMPRPRPELEPEPLYGEIFDRGYQRYEGPRFGQRHAMRALWGYSIARAFGVKKRWTAKVIPIVLYVGVAMPVIISIGIKAFLPDASVLEYWDFFAFVFLLQGVFAATVAPELLCGDRQERVLTLYFARAISRAGYLVSKALAAATMMLTMSLAPAIVLWLGRQLLDDSPLSAMRDHLPDLLRLTVGSVMVSLYLGAGGLMIASFTKRKAIAVAVTLVVTLVAAGLSAALAAVIGSDLRRFLVFLSPPTTISGMALSLFGREATIEPYGDALLPLWQYLAAMGGTVMIALVVMAWRYLPDE